MSKMNDRELLEEMYRNQAHILENQRAMFILMSDIAAKLDAKRNLRGWGEYQRDLDALLKRR